MICEMKFSCKANNSCLSGFKKPDTKKYDPHKRFETLSEINKLFIRLKNHGLAQNCHPGG